MAEIVNLNRVRKSKAKKAAAERAGVNRVAFGRTRIEKEESRKAREKIEAELNGKKLED